MIASTRPEPATIHIVDDDASLRESLEDLMHSVGLPVRGYGSAREFLDADPGTGPACLVLDVRLPGQSGMDLLRSLQQARRRMPVVMITGHGDIPMSVAAMKLGAVDFLTKPFRDQDLLDTIHAAVEKDRAQLASASGSDEVQARWDTLTEGEKAVMERVVRGMLNKQIAAELNVSEITVKVRRGRVMRKMQVRTLADLVRAGGQLGG
ncbi:response regulator [Achromobacter sp. SIMBA_011]|jgi:FixJ family two-component response regulator|uniref:response regulator transcription factor n=1 Tax=Achromobacter TaxID=222 RepID=UPI0006BEF619|nr:response regulator [Achromobacter dolens]MBQ2648006.1 response regulator transcription factor [Achromobacter sp.]OAS99168.1 DNA-binding response regulator [Achromobacter xylosoxidans]MCZ8407885.1 response regulator [Achromobacter dolens]CAB3626363.1 Response regulator protein TodT [Achromobacter dolens]CUI84718.1 Transcriptional regulatory protein fixJ [Achromobacter dolens]